MKRYLFAFMLSMTSLAALNSSYAMMDDEAREARYISSLRAVQEDPTEFSAVIKFADSAMDWLVHPKSPMREHSKLRSAHGEISALMGNLPEWGEKYAAKLLMELDLHLQNFPAFFRQVNYLEERGQHANAVLGLTRLAQNGEADQGLRSRACEMRHEIYSRHGCYQDSFVPNLIFWARIDPSQQERTDNLLEETLGRSSNRENHIQAAEYYSSRREVDKAARSYVTALSLPHTAYEPQFGAAESFLASDGVVKARVKALLKANQGTEKAVYEKLLQALNYPYYGPREKDEALRVFNEFMGQNNSPFARELRVLLDPEMSSLDPATPHPLLLAKVMAQKSLERDLERSYHEVCNLNYALELHRNPYKNRVRTNLVILFAGVMDEEYGSYPAGTVSYEEALEMYEQAKARKVECEQRLAINKRRLMDAFSSLTLPQQGAVRVLLSQGQEAEKFYPLPQLLQTQRPDGFSVFLAGDQFQRDVLEKARSIFGEVGKKPSSENMRFYCDRILGTLILEQEGWRHRSALEWEIEHILRDNF